MTPEQILKEISDWLEYMVEYEGVPTPAMRRYVSPEKLAVFLSKHLKGTST